MRARRTITIAWSRSQSAVYRQEVLTWVRYHCDKRRYVDEPPPAVQSPLDDLNEAAGAAADGQPDSL
jgi:hypothetical protein